MWLTRVKEKGKKARRKWVRNWQMNGKILDELGSAEEEEENTSVR